MEEAQDDLLSKRRRNRPSLVCKPCKKRKVKCDRGSPCELCVKNKIPDQCVFESNWTSPDESYRVFKNSSKPTKARPHLTGDHLTNLNNLTGVISTKPYKSGRIDQISPPNQPSASPIRGDNMIMVKQSEFDALKTMLASLELQLEKGLKVETKKPVIIKSDNDSNFEVQEENLKVIGRGTTVYNQQVKKFSMSNPPLHFPSYPGKVIFDGQVHLFTTNATPECAVSENANRKTDISGERSTLCTISDNQDGYNPYRSPDDAINFYDDYICVYTNGTSRRSNFGPLLWSALLRKDKILLNLKSYMSSQKQDQPPDMKASDTKKFEEKAMESDGINDIRPYPSKDMTPEDSVASQTKNYQFYFDFGILNNTSLVSREKQLIEMIERHLPTQKAIWMYIDRFFEVAVAFIPFVDQEEFLHKMVEIIGPRGDRDEKIKKFTVSKRLDLAYVSMFLVFIRFSYICVKCKSGRDQAEIDETYRQSFDYMMANPISPEFIDLSKLCISQFEILRKTSLPVLQATFFIRNYHMYAPELGDGADGGDAQSFNGMLINMAYSLGLNREPDKFGDYLPNSRENNVGRKIWYHLLISDFVCSYTFGNPLSSRDIYYDTKLPIDEMGSANLANLTVESFVCNCHYYCKNLLHGPFAEMLPMILNVNKSVKYSDLPVHLNAMETFMPKVFGHFSDYVNCLEDKSFGYQFSKALKFKILCSLKAFRISMYYHFFLDFERKNSTELTFFYLKKLVKETVVDVIPTVMALVHAPNELFGPSLDVFVNPVFLQLVHRTAETLIAAITRNNLHILALRLEPGFDLKWKTDKGTRKFISDLITSRDNMEGCARVMIFVLRNFSKDYYYAWGATRSLTFVMKEATKQDFYLNYIKDPSKPKQMLLTSEMIADLNSMVEVSLKDAERLVKEHCSCEETIQLLQRRELDISDESVNTFSSTEILSPPLTSGGSDVGSLGGFPESFDATQINSGYHDFNFGNEDEINSLWFETLNAQNTKFGLGQDQGGFANFEDSSYFNFFSELPMDKVFQ